MNTVAETDPGQCLKGIPLAEVEETGVGAVYEIAVSINIEPVAVYIGNGYFKGLHIEQRGSLHTLRLSLEEHRDTQAGQTALPIRTVGRISPDTLQNDSELFMALIDRTCMFYASAAEHGLRSVYSLDQADIEAKLLFFTDTHSKLLGGEITIGEEGVIDLSK